MKGRIVVALGIGIALCAILPSHAKVSGARNLYPRTKFSSGIIEEFFAKIPPSREVLGAEINYRSTMHHFYMNGWLMEFKGVNPPPEAKAEDKKNKGQKEETKEQKLCFLAFATKSDMEFAYRIELVGDPEGLATLHVRGPIPYAVYADNRTVLESCPNNNALSQK